MLAVKLMQEQGIDILGLNFSSVFCIKSENDACIKKTAGELKMPVTILNITEELLQIVKNPRFGRGKNMNPCIDCRIFSFKKAREFMKKTGASFIVTGEVAGERPMSQTKRALVLIEKESDLEGVLLRPLSAKLFKPTLPEQQDIINRDKLMDISGRSREKQMLLAHKYDIKEYPNPAGGCLLTDKNFSRKLEDLLENNPGHTIEDLKLLKTGRQFRISEEVKFFVGRNENENNILLSMAGDEDFLFDAVNIPSPIALGKGSLNKKDIETISSVIARYSDAKNEKTVNVSYKKVTSKTAQAITVTPANENLISSLRI